MTENKDLLNNLLSISVFFSFFLDLGLQVNDIVSEDRN